MPVPPLALLPVPPFALLPVPVPPFALLPEPLPPLVLFVPPFIASTTGLSGRDEHAPATVATISAARAPAQTPEVEGIRMKWDLSFSSAIARLRAYGSGGRSTDTGSSGLGFPISLPRKLPLG